MDEQSTKVLSEEEKRKLSQILGELVTGEQLGAKENSQINTVNNFNNQQDQEPSLRVLLYALIIIIILLAALIKGYLYISEQARFTLQTLQPNTPPSPTGIIISPTIEASSEGTMASPTINVRY